MSATVFQSSRYVTLLGGGNVSADELEEALSLAPDLVAADGGADAALRLGLTPDAIIGDMDSISADSLARLPADRVHRIAEQDSTDFDKTLRSVRAPLLLGVGFLGGRIDHELAALNVLVQRSERRCILIGARDIVFAAPRRAEFLLSPAMRVSLFPMRTLRGRSVGLHWPIDGIALSPGGRVGTSNRVSDRGDGRIVLEFEAAGMLVILPRRALNAAITGLQAAGNDVRGE